MILFFSCTKKEEQNPTSYLFSKLDNTTTGIDFQNQIQEDEKYNIVNYLYYYNGGGVAVGDINNDDLPDLYFVSNRGQNKLYINQGDFKFKDITSTSGTGGNSDWNTGVTMVDINGDGFLDIYVCAVINILGFQGHNELFINNGDGTFTEESEKYGLNYKGYATQAYFFDYDKDDDLDVYIVNHALHTKTSHGPSYIRKKRTDYVGDVLLKNENSKFTDVSLEAKIHGGANGYGLSASIADFNNDGWDDIYVCNDFHEDDYYYINQGDGTFNEELPKHFSHTSRFSMGSDAADLDGDGFQDLITLDMLPYQEKVLKESDGDVSYKTQEFLISQGYQKQYARNMLQMNKSGDFFIEKGLYDNIAATDWSWAPLIADYNLDGHQDLFITNGIYKRPNNLDFMRYMSNSFKNQHRGKEQKNTWLIKSLKVMPTGETPNAIFEGNSETFRNKTGDWIKNTPTLSNGATYADLDNDGDLDLIVNNLNDFASIYKNGSSDDPNKSFLSIGFDYKPANKSGIGTRVFIYSNDEIQNKQLFTSRGFISSIEPKLHFGLGEKNIDSIKVIWPDNTCQNINLADFKSKDIEIKYDTQNLTPYTYERQTINPIFKKEQLANFKHQEDQYNDFDVNKLIPYKVSTQGPAIAIGDINNDGQEDVFIGGASLQKSRLLVSTNQKLQHLPIPVIENDSISEDIDATFFDADGDNDLDLYVASGIINSRHSEFQNDRLYINDGSGNFSKSSIPIPGNNLNTAVVQAYDYDQDGDVDIFVGNRSDSSNFGKKVNSYLLKNQGNLHFIKDENFLLTSMVTDAIWEDINNDNIKDLLITTEWDKPRIFINNNGILKETKIKANITGLWQSIAFYDIDFDGDKDILLGNWGQNTKFKPTEEQPLMMYYGDFDKNNKNETLLAYAVDGKYYPVNSKDEFASQINIINKHYTDYKSYANQTIEEILKSLNIDTTGNTSSVATLKSGYLRNTNGTFEDFVEFPPALQLSTINCFLANDFLGEGYQQILLGGNFYGLNTYHGIFNSNPGFLITKSRTKNTFSYISPKQVGLNLHNKELRFLKKLTFNQGEYLISGFNNDSISFFRHNTNSSK